MKRCKKKIISLFTTVVVTSSIFSGNYLSAFAADSNATSQSVGGKYSTNGIGNGKEANITIDGDYSDWSEDMLIAQGLANDSPVKFKGDWENCVIDSYSLYAAWDDENLYVAWQNVNTADICNGQGGALADGKLRDLHQFILIDTGSGNNLNGKCTGDQGIWNNQLTFETPVTHVFAVHADGSGTPGIFTSDGTGSTNYTTNCGDFDDEGVEFGFSNSCLPKQLMGIYQIPSNEEGVAMLYDDSVPAVDLLTKGKHDSSEDTFFEMKIPFTALGITKDEFLQNGVGIMQMGLRGESALDCVPHDPSMLDNVFGSYAKEPSNSHEKDDNDVITVPLARAGGSGHIIDQGFVSISSFDANVSSPQNVGSTVKFTTEATGTNGVQYQYSVDGEVVKDYSTSNTLNWTPSKEGTYTITVKVKNGKGKVTSKSMTYVIEKSQELDVVMSKLSAEKDSPQKVNTSIKFTAKASGGTGTLKYKYTIKKGTTNIISSSYSTNSSYTWTPTTEGTYTILAEVKDDNGKTDSKSIQYVIEDINDNELKINTFTTTLKSPQIAGSAISLVARAEGKGELKYKFVVYGEDGSRKEIQSYSEKKSAAWIPTKAQNYKLFVRVKDSTGKEVQSQLNYVIKDNLKINSISKSVLSPQEVGSSVKITINATGASQYRFVAYDENKNATVIKNYSSKNTATWTPSKEGKYKVYCKARNSAGKEVCEMFEYVITKAEPIKIQSLTASVQSPQPAGTSIKFNTVAKGNNTLSYKYWVLDPQGNIKALSSYSTTSSITWKPTIKGNYLIWVDVKDNLGNIKSEMIAYNVTSKETTIEENNSKLSYTGTWKKSTNSNYSNSTVKYTVTKDSSVTMKFTGTGVKVLATLGNNKGVAKIVIDGKTYSADMFSEKTKYKAVAFEALDLKAGNHTITIKCSGLQSGESLGNLITIDSFKILDGNII